MISSATIFLAKALLAVIVATVLINAALDILKKANWELVHWLGVAAALAAAMHAAAWDFSFWFAFSFIQ
jgi:hypothetical protein